MKKDRLPQLTTIQEILKVLARTKGHISIAEIAKEINELHAHDERETNFEAVKRNIKKIQTEMGYELISRKGKDGGYALAESDWKFLATISNERLTDEEKNALNDAFEIAERSSTYYYVEDLKTATAKLYTRFDLKDQDFEYYVGKVNRDSKGTALVKEIKRAIKNHLYTNIKTKYEYYKVPKEMEEVKILYLIHDPDESFIVLRYKQKEYILNILNIKEFKVTNIKYQFVANTNIEKYINEYTLKIKGQYKISFKILTERGRSIFNLWKHQFEDISKENTKMKTLIFYEKYQLNNFMFNMKDHIKLRSEDKVSR